jgi:protein-disulfide isomerase
MTRTHFALALSALFAGCQVAADPTPGVVLEADPGERYQAALGAMPARGPKEAKLTILEFTDYQCPFCRKSQETVEALVAAYPNDIRLQIVHFPLTQIHSHAGLAARATAAAAAQGRFWEMHERLFAADGKLSRGDLVRYAEELGLDRAAFEAALDSKEISAAVESDIALATRLGVRGVPAFFINGRKVQGALPLERLKAIVEEELALADSALARGVEPAKLYEEITRQGAAAAVPTDAQPEMVACPNEAASDCDCAHAE